MKEKNLSIEQSSTSTFFFYIAADDDVKWLQQNDAFVATVKSLIVFYGVKTVGVCEFKSLPFIT